MLQVDTWSKAALRDDKVQMCIEACDNLGYTPLAFDKAMVYLSGRKKLQILLKKKALSEKRALDTATAVDSTDAAADDDDLASSKSRRVALKNDTNTLLLTQLLINYLSLREPDEHFRQP